MYQHFVLLCTPTLANNLVQIGYRNHVNISEVHDSHNLLRLELNYTTTIALTFFVACIWIIFYLVVRYR